MLNSNTESKIMHLVSRLPPSPVYSCFMAIVFRLQEKTYDHAVERFTMLKDPLRNFFVLVMLCSVVGKFSASHVDHIVILLTKLAVN